METEFRARIASHVGSLPTKDAKFRKFNTSPFVLMFYTLQNEISRISEIEGAILPAKLFSSMETSAGRMVESVVLPKYGWESAPSAMHSANSAIAGKKITGRKRHIAVDTLGMIPAVVVHGAYWQDHDGACFVLMRLRQLGRLKVVFADSAYGRCALPGWVKETFGWILQTVLRPMKAKGFAVLPKRWIVERTFAWISRCRRHSKDYERTTATSETMIYVTMIGLMSRRLGRPGRQKTI